MSDSTNINNSILYTIDEFVLLGRCNKTDNSYFNQSARSDKSRYTLSALKKLDLFNTITSELAETYNTKLGTYNEIILEKVDVSDCSFNFTTSTLTVYENEHLIVSSHAFIDLNRIVNYGTIHNAGYIKGSQCLNYGFIYNHGTFEIKGNTTPIVNGIGNPKSLFYNQENASFCNFNYTLFENTEITQDSFFDSKQNRYSTDKYTIPCTEIKDCSFINQENGIINIENSFNLVNTEFVNHNIIIQQPGSIVDMTNGTIQQHFAHICEGEMHFQNDAKYILDYTSDTMKIPFILNIPEISNNIISDYKALHLKRETLYFDVEGSINSNNTTFDDGTSISVGLDDIMTDNDLPDNDLPDNGASNSNDNLYVFTDLNKDKSGVRQTIFVKKNETLVLKGTTRIYNDIINLGTIVVYDTLQNHNILNFGTIYNKGTISNIDISVFYNLCNGIVWNVNELGITKEVSLYYLLYLEECTIETKSIKTTYNELNKVAFVLNNYSNIDYKTLRIHQGQQLSIRGKLENYDSIINDGTIIIEQDCVLINFGMIRNNNKIEVNGTLDNTYGILYNNGNIENNPTNSQNLQDGGYDTSKGMLIYDISNGSHSLSTGNYLYPLREYNLYSASGEVIFIEKDVKDKYTFFRQDISGIPSIPNNVSDFTNPPNSTPLQIGLFPGSYVFNINPTDEKYYTFDISSDISNIVLVKTENVTQQTFEVNGNDLLFSKSDGTNSNITLTFKPPTSFENYKRIDIRFIVNDDGTNSEYEDFYTVNGTPIRDVSDINYDVSENHLTIEKNQLFNLNDNMILPFHIEHRGYLYCEQSTSITISGEITTHSYSTISIQENADVRFLSTCHFQFLSTIYLKQSSIYLTSSTSHTLSNNIIGDDSDENPSNHKCFVVFQHSGDSVLHQIDEHFNCILSTISGEPLFESNLLLQDFVLDQSNVLINNINEKLRTLSLLQSTLDVYKSEPGTGIGDHEFVFANIKNKIDYYVFTNKYEHCVLIDQNTRSEINIHNKGTFIIHNDSTFTIKNGHNMVNYGTLIINSGSIIVLETNTSLLNYGIIINNGTLHILSSSTLKNENLLENRNKITIEKRGTLVNISILKGGGTIDNKGEFDQKLISRNKEVYQTDLTSAKYVYLGYYNDTDKNIDFTKIISPNADINKFIDGTSIGIVGDISGFIELHKDNNGNIIGIKSDGIYSFHSSEKRFKKDVSFSVVILTENQILHLLKKETDPFIILGLTILLQYTKYNKMYTFTQNKLYVLQNVADDDKKLISYDFSTKTHNFISLEDKFSSIHGNVYSDQYLLINKNPTINTQIVLNDTKYNYNPVSDIITTIYYATTYKNNLIILSFVDINSYTKSIVLSRIDTTDTTDTTVSNNYFIGHYDSSNNQQYTTLSGEEVVVDLISSIHTVKQCGNNGRFLIMSCSCDANESTELRIINLDNFVSTPGNPDIASYKSFCHLCLRNDTTNLQNIDISGDVCREKINYFIDDYRQSRDENTVLAVTETNKVIEITLHTSNSTSNISYNETYYNNLFEIYVKGDKIYGFMTFIYLQI